MRTLVTIGTDSGDWAPPKPVELGLTTDVPSGLGITNLAPVSWRLTGSARIVIAAIAVGAAWARVDVAPMRVVEHQDLVIAALAIAIDVNLPTLSGDPIRAQGLLVEGGRGELTP